MIEVYGTFRMRAVGKGSLSGARLFRSRQLSAITPEEGAVLTNVLGVRSVFDVRTQWEVAASPEPYLVGVKTTAFEPTFERKRKNAESRLIAGVIGEYGAPEERMKANYRRYAKDYPLIGTALRTVASEQATTLIHCVNGKDRTGVICATLLRIAGVHIDDVVGDYLATNDIVADLIDDEFNRLSKGMSLEEEKILKSFLEARPSYLFSFFEEAESTYGSFDRYVTDGLKLNEAQCESLRAMVSF